jgi:RNA polymerase sigma-70 factor (ECF subfamily)
MWRVLVEGEGAPVDEARAFEAMFASHRHDLARFAERRVGADAAADVVSEVFLIAWRRRGDYRVDQARLWLFGVARHVIANQRRGERRRERLGHRIDLDGAGVVVADIADAATLAVQVRVLLTALPWSEQEALRLAEWDQLDHGEAAVVAGCSRATFRVRLHRARRHFARLIVEAGLTPSAHPPSGSGDTDADETDPRRAVSHTTTGKDEST